MNGSDDWGPWIPHSPPGCPVSEGVTVKVKAKCGCEHVLRIDGADHEAGNIDWTVCDFPIRCHHCKAVVTSPGIAHYSIRKPRGLTILEAALRDTEQPNELAETVG